MRQFLPLISSFQTKFEVSMKMKNINCNFIDNKFITTRHGCTISMCKHEETSKDGVSPSHEATAPKQKYEGASEDGVLLSRKATKHPKHKHKGQAKMVFVSPKRIGRKSRR